MSSQRREPAPVASQHLPQAHEEAEIPDELLTHVAAGSTAQVVLAVVTVLAVCYVAKLVMITIASSLLLAFMLEPIVWRLQRWHVPRSAGSFIAVVLLLGCVYGVCRYSYNSAITFLDDLPKYADKLRATTLQFRRHTEQLQKTTDAVLPESAQEKAVMKVKTQSTWTDWLTNSASSLTELLVVLSFIPFLVYFMLSWKDRMRVATVRLFSPEHRPTAHETLGAIASMLHGFIIGNLLCGLFVSGGCVLAFSLLQIPYFYFLGFISGFLCLIPYLGTILAMVPPLAAGIGTLSGTGIIAVAAIVFGLDMFAVNVLFPKLIGKRLQLNPLVVTIALLVWGWIWGAMGLVLAIPITGAMKIIFDHINTLRPFGRWLEE